MEEYKRENHWSNPYWDCVQALSDRCIYHEMFRLNGEYEHESEDVILLRKAAFMMSKLIKRCIDAEEAK